jgi:hypothetical protein
VSFAPFLGARSRRATRWPNASRGARLQQSDCAKGQLQDTAIGHIAALVGLEYVYFPGAALTDSAVMKLGTLTTLRMVGLEGATNFAGRSVAYLTGLTRLERLLLSGTRVTDGGIGYLRAFSRLKDLALSSTELTDEHLCVIPDLDSLEVLSIARNPQVKTLGCFGDWRMTALRVLVLSGTSAGDAVVMKLASLPNLRTLWLGGTAVTLKAAEALQEKMPWCYIDVLDKKHGRT